MRARSRFPAVLAAALFAVTGCGSDGGTGSGGAAQVAPSKTASAEQESADSGEDGAAQAPQALWFTGTTVDGKPFDAKTLAGKPAVLWFRAPWCPKCRAQAAETAKVATDYQGKPTSLASTPASVGTGCHFM